MRTTYPAHGVGVLALRRDRAAVALGLVVLQNRLTDGPATA